MKSMITKSAAPRPTKLFLLVSVITCLFAIGSGTKGQAQSPSGKAVPAFVKNGQPSVNHARLNALIGDWNVDSTYYMAGGTPQKPLRATRMVAQRKWVNGKRFVQEVKEGVINGSPYHRIGYLGYSNLDHRYEWNTVDMTNTNQMTYFGRKGDENAEISMSGVFTDQGLLGDQYIGKEIGQRTVIQIENSDRNIVKLYVTPPGEKERLGSQDIFTRVPIAEDPETIVRQQENVLMMAYCQADTQTLEKVFAPSFIFINSKGNSQDRQEVINDYQAGRIKTVSMKPTETRIVLDHDDEIASVVGTVDQEDIIEGHSVKGTRRFTRVWNKQDGVWKLVAFQLSPIIRNKMAGLKVHVYSEPGIGSVNSYILEGESGVVIIDAQRSLSSAKKLVASIEQVGSPVVAIFLTHAHPDHFGGLPVLKKAYPRAPIYALKQTRDSIATGANGYTSQSKQVLKADFDTNIPLPTHLVSTGEEVTVAGVRFQIEDAGQGETDHMMMLYVPDEDTLFCGDVIQHDMTAFLLEDHLEAWLTQISEVTAKYGEVKTVYPGHGASGSAAELFSAQRLYLETFQRLTSEEKDAEGKISPKGKKRIVQTMNRAYPGFLPVAAIPDLLEKNVDAVAGKK